MLTKGSRNASLTNLILLAALSVLSACTTVVLYYMVQHIVLTGISRWQRELDVDAFTFVGDDFPDYLPFDVGGVGIEGGKEWPFFSIPVDQVDRSYRLGPQNRTFVIAMFHELHCIETLEAVIAKDEDHPAGMGHLQHCFNFLRQWTLCKPDLTLEPGDFVSQGPSRDLVTSTRTCRNWDILYRHATQNYRDWADFTVMQNWNFTE